MANGQRGRDPYQHIQTLSKFRGCVDVMHGSTRTIETRESYHAVAFHKPHHNIEMPQPFRGDFGKYQELNPHASRQNL